MDNEEELQAIFKELSRENQAYLLQEARRSQKAETPEKDRCRPQWTQAAAPAVRVQ